MKTVPSKKIEPHTQWGTIYNRDLAEFTKEEILEISPKEVTDIHMPRRKDDNRLMGFPIIEMEFENVKNNMIDYTTHNIDKKR